MAKTHFGPAFSDFGPVGPSLNPPLKGSGICAIGMVDLPFVVNLKFSRAVDGKNILKLPRPTLLEVSARLSCDDSVRFGSVWRPIEANMTALGRTQ